MRHRPPHLSTWILLQLIPEAEREALVGDLMEEYALRTSGASSSEARRWYRRQICASVPALWWSRPTRAAWISTAGVALLAYIAVGIVETVVHWTLSSLAAHGAAAYGPLDLITNFPMVVVIGYVAARYRRRAAIVLGAMMLLAVTVMTLTSHEDVPLWYRIAYFFVGPAAALIGSALRSRRSVHKSSTATRD